MVGATRIERGLDVEQRTLWIGHVWIDGEQESGLRNENKMGKLEHKMKTHRKIKVKINLE